MFFLSVTRMPRRNLGAWGLNGFVLLAKKQVLRIVINTNIYRTIEQLFRMIQNCTA